MSTQKPEAKMSDLERLAVAFVRASRHQARYLISTYSGSDPHPQLEEETEQDLLRLVIDQLEENEPLEPDFDDDIKDVSDSMVKALNGWKWIDHGSFVEVLPLADLKEHNLGDECWCNPRRIDEQGERPVISHNAKDGRS